MYGLSCELGNCNQERIGRYDGETLRPIDDRFGEHYKAARNPNAESYKNKPMASINKNVEVVNNSLHVFGTGFITIILTL